MTKGCAGGPDVRDGGVELLHRGLAAVPADGRRPPPCVSVLPMTLSTGSRAGWEEEEQEEEHEEQEEQEQERRRQQYAHQSPRRLQVEVKHVIPVLERGRRREGPGCSRRARVLSFCCPRLYL